MGAWCFCLALRVYPCSRRGTYDTRAKRGKVEGLSLLAQGNP